VWFGQGDVEGRALSYCAFRPDFAVVSVDDAVGYAEPDAGAGIFFFGVEALEGDEEFVGIGHVKANAIVFYGEGYVVCRLLLFGNCDAWCGAFTGELPGVADDVVKEGTEEVLVAFCSESFFDGDVDLAFGFCSFVVMDDVVG
jgi:hypothetical protein